MDTGAIVASHADSQANANASAPHHCHHCEGGCCCHPYQNDHGGYHTTSTNIVTASHHHNKPPAPHHQNSSAESLDFRVEGFGIEIFTKRRRHSPKPGRASQKCHRHRLQATRGEANPPAFKDGRTAWAALAVGLQVQGLVPRHLGGFRVDGSGLLVRSFSVASGTVVKPH